MYINSGVSQESVLGPILYLLFPADMSTTRLTVADDTASHTSASKASTNLQINFNKIRTWHRRCKIKANESKSVHVTHSMKQEVCSPVFLNNSQLTQQESANYFGLHLGKTNMAETYLHTEETARP